MNWIKQALADIGESRSLSSALHFGIGYGVAFALYKKMPDGVGYKGAIIVALYVAVALFDWQRTGARLSKLKREALDARSFADACQRQVSMVQERLNEALEVPALKCGDELWSLEGTRLQHWTVVETTLTRYSPSKTGHARLKVQLVGDGHLQGAHRNVEVNPWSGKVHDGSYFNSAGAAAEYVTAQALNAQAQRGAK